MALRLFLDALGVPTDIETLNERKTVQKSVYLGQLTGVDLGYRYEWYKLGPFSRDLARDYYGLAESLVLLGDADCGGKRLRHADKLTNLRPLLDVPEKIKLSRDEWLELLASVHFIKKVQTRGCSDKQVAQQIREEKPHLEEYASEALDRLAEFKLL